MIPDIEVYMKGPSGQYLLVARKFGVVVRSDNLHAGVKEVETRMAEVRRELLDVDADLPPAHRDSEQRTPWFGLLVPIIATCLAPWAVIGLMLFIAVAPVVSAMTGNGDRITAAHEAMDGNVARAGHAGADWLIRAADTLEQLTPARKEELRLAIRKIADTLTPLTDEIRPLLTDPNARRAPGPGVAAGP
jgi:hypothetical protein